VRLFFVIYIRRRKKMKCIKNNLPKELSRIEIEIFSDLHLGSRKCDYEEIKNRIERVKNNEHVYAIILGDVLNNSTKSSVGDVYSEELTPMQEVQKATMMFEPIKDKILGVCSGNHERRSYKTEGIDLLYFMCAELGIADKYDYCSCLLFIRMGIDSTRAKDGKNSRQICYTLYMTHGDGQGGRTVGGKANGLQRRGQIVDADIVVTGHTHAPLSFRDCCYRIDYQNSTVTIKEQLFVNASATLNYEEYAELYGMKPSSKQSPVLVLNGKKKEVVVTM
jgi:predicted phosphodiesterase